MDPTEYQREAARTECNQFAAGVELTRQTLGGDVQGVRALHAVVGMAGELGELMSLIEKRFWYRRAGDYTTAVKDELGDLMWYAAQLCRAMGLDLGDVMVANLRKLRERYPDKFDAGRCLERDVARETLAVLGDGAPRAANPLEYPFPPATAADPSDPDTDEGAPQCRD